MFAFRSIAFAISVFSFLTLPLPAQDIPDPETFFGHEIGAEGQIIDYARSLEYYRLMAERSPRVVCSELGKTTDGNPFVLLTISSPENLAKLDEILQLRHRLRDPRITDRKEANEIAGKMPAVVFHTGSIHSSEISTAQVPPLVIYKLVAGNDSETDFILRNTVILFSPSANPDGQYKYNQWYAKHKGQPWEGRMPWLYHTYVGHDNNRDWVFMHFKEQRLTAEHVHNKWNPIYSLEMHEFGSTAGRIFVPPYQDPYDYNVAPQVISTMNAMGMAIASRLTSLGLAGVVQNAHFDLYTPARAYQMYRGTARILTETASGNFAGTVTILKNQLDRDYVGTGAYNPARQSWNFPLVWPGGKWTLKDRIEYQYQANFALLRYAASHREQFALNLYNGIKYVLDRDDWPSGYIISVNQSDPAAAKRLLQLMRFGEIEIEKVTESIRQGDEDILAGSYFISLHQPYAAWVKTLFEVQEYPDYRKNSNDLPIPPYDITGHTLPLLMNVDVTEIKDAESLGTVPAESDNFFVTDIQEKTGYGYLFSPASGDAYTLMNRLLKAGVQVGQIQKPITVDGLEVCSGCFYIQADPDVISPLVADLAVKLVPVSTDIHEKLKGIRRPQIGVYEPWGGLMDAGWTKFMLEQFEFEFTTVRNKDLQDPDKIKQYDVILFPNGLRRDRLENGTDFFPPEYRGGLGDKGVKTVTEYIRNGGVVAGWGSTSQALAELLQIPFKDLRAELERTEYFDPGCIVSVDLEIDHPVNFGLCKNTGVIVRYSPLLEFNADRQEIISRFSQVNPRLSGFLLGEKKIAGKANQAVISMGQGRVVLFTTLPQFRSMTYNTIKQIFNTAIWSEEVN